MFHFALNPLKNYLAFWIVGVSGKYYSYHPLSGHAWFLLWLMVFNSCYVMISGLKCRGGKLVLVTDTASTSVTPAADPESGSSAAPPSSAWPSFGRIMLVCVLAGLLNLAPSLMMNVAGVGWFAGAPLGLSGQGLVNPLFYGAGSPNPN